MGDDADSPPEREMKDFQFRQMKKVQVFEAAEDMPKDRSSLLTVSNKYGLTFVGLGRTFKVYLTLNILAADKADGMTGDMSLHHLALSCDELTLSVCGTSEETGLSIAFYDVRTFINKARPQKSPFASLQPAVASDALVQDLKWNPAQPSMLAACLSDGSMMILEVTDSVKIQAQLLANSGVTFSWSPKGKQVAVGKMNATVSQYTPALEEKRVIPCPPFYNSDDPVKALDVLWLRTPVFAVAYVYADGCLETPPELVLISLPKKDEKVEPKYLNFGESVFGSCTERQHHYFLSHIEDWDLMLAASAASIEVSVIARQDDRMWEVWLLEDASRAELPVTETNDDTLPLGLAIDYTSQQEIQITDEKTLPPAPTMLMLSTEGVLCPFALLNLNPGVKQLVSPFTALTLEGERQPKPAFPNIALASVSSASSAPASSAPAASSLAVPFNFVPAAPVSSSSSEFTFSVPTTHATTTLPPAFSLGGSGPFSSVSSSFSFASKPPSETPSAASAFSFSTPSMKPAAPAPAPVSTPQSLPAASLPSVKLNLNDRYSTLFLFYYSFYRSFLFTFRHEYGDAKIYNIIGKTALIHSRNEMFLACHQIAHFQKELDDLKSRSTKADFKVGTNDGMKDLRKESEDLHIFTLEIKETTESLHGDIGTLKTTLIEGFAGAEEAKTQSELSKDKNYRQLLYKKSLDPRSEEQLKEIRRLYQYVTSAVEDVNDVLDVEWEKHLEKKKKQKHMVVPGREGLFTTLSNNIYIINQQKNRLDQLVQELTSLRLYSKNAAPSISQNILESLKDAFLKARLDVTPPKVKISPIKQSQLRNFLSKGQMPPVRSTAPANLSRSAFLSPKYYEDLDDASSTSSLSQSLEPHPSHLDQEEEELQPLQPPAVTALSTPRHPTVVRTPSIQPGFGGIQSTPLPKIHSAPSLGFGLSPIPSPGNYILGADSTALATKTVKHGAPPTERTVPMSAQQAAANAAMRRQMANQKPGSSSLTESTLKTVPQVVNVQELKEKGLPVQVSSIISPFSDLVSIVLNNRSIYPHSFSCFSFYFPAVKDVSKFSFGGNGKMVFGQTAEEPFSLTPKSVASSIGTGTPTLPLSTSGEAAKHSSLSTAFRTEPQPPKTSGGETLGCFSGLRVGPGEEIKDTVTKPAAAFTFGEPGLGSGKGVQSFSFASGFQKPAEDSGTTDLSKGASSSSLFKPPETNSKTTFSLPPSNATPSTLPTSFSSLLAGSSEEPKAPPQLSEPTPPPEKEPSTTEPAGENASQSVAPEPAVDSSSTATTTPALPALTTATIQDLPSANVAPAEVTPPAPSVVPFSTKPTPAPAATPVPASAPVPAPATTDSSSIGATPVINTAAPVATTTTPTTVTPAPTTTANTVFGQQVVPPASSAPSATGFGSTGFSASTGAGFNKSVFGQSGFGQPAGSAGSSSGFSFTQSVFGPSSSSATTGGTSLFGASTAGGASSFSFGSGSTNTASSTGSGMFGQSTTPAFGQSSGFGQPSGFGSNTTTSSSSGFSFEHIKKIAIFLLCLSHLQSSSGNSLFGSTSANAAGSSSGGFFSGLGGKPSEDAANKNPFGAAGSTGGFGQPAQSGSNNLFGNSGAKAFGFGQTSSAFGDQKPSGTFSTGGGSVASQGFGSFSSPTKPGGFGSPPVFGSPPSFGGSPAFGNTASFGTSPSFSNALNPSTGKVFGEGTAAANMGGFGFSSAPSAPSFGALASQTPPSFGTLVQQGSTFGSQPSSFSGFGQQPQTGGEAFISLDFVFWVFFVLVVVVSSHHF
uniref:Nuclear pore complex protein Nup214 n=1 Tax=Xiphophorus couchianus TaxID=32473 RepID=A0A3B5KTB2_9TELE